MNSFYQEHQNGSTNQNPADLQTAIAQLKSQVSDPNAMIQQLLKSGKVSQAQYNAACQKAQILQGLMQNK